MRKSILLSAAVAVTLVGATWNSHTAYADVHRHNSHAHHSDDSQVSRQVASQAYPQDNSSSKASHTSIYASTDLNQIVTQFQQAISQYTKNEPASHKNVAPGAAEANGTGYQNGALPSVGIKVGNQSASSENRTDLDNRVQSQPPGSLTARGAGKNTPVSPQKQTPSKDSAVSKSTKSSSSPTKQETSVQLSQSLATYQQATDADANGQAALKHAMQSYVNALQSTFSKHQTPSVQAYQQNTSNALQLIQSALRLQSYNSAYEAALQQEADKRDSAAMVSTLTKMTSNEQNKASALTQAAQLLAKAAVAT
ncbi:hypothetical protein [Alicyclobacillus fastidiosus]|uniref:Uncharacterized protein n=1 Tax=Alicyclobacillus fastidiosus TaxID=392011 RepID=A0ABV5ABH0_9BACL|nr:hypothetical protein [Alicyclobacillus fastidiosus]WEH10427.1 hypothetical protein PYS47_04120 [Alicyclobacillus fastidiosus]